jgi:hypothetical protein
MVLILSIENFIHRSVHPKLPLLPKMAKNKGGHPVDEFVHAHFTTVGEKTASKKWNMHSKYCLADTVKTIVHRDSRCLMHLAKTGEGFRSHAPAEVQASILRSLGV